MLPRSAWMTLVCAVAVAWPAGAAAAAPVAAPVVAPTSASQLRFGMSALTATSSLPITAPGAPQQRVIYSVRLDRRLARSTVHLRGMVQTAYCRSGDLRGVNKPDHPCAGTVAYDYDPKVHVQAVLATSPTAISGRLLRSWEGVTCRDITHHCPVFVSADRLPVAGAGRFVNLVARAHAEGAVPGQVLPVERRQGQLQVMQARAPIPVRTFATGVKQGSFAVSAGGSDAPEASERPAVIFSRAVTVGVGDVLDVRTSFRLTENSPDNAPFTGTAILLSRSPRATEPAPGMTIIRRAGENCPQTCSFGRLGALRSPVAGRVYVNVVVLAKDHEGVGGATMTYHGSLTVTRRGR